jgi:hypothetical protein
MPLMRTPIGLWRGDRSTVIDRGDWVCGDVDAIIRRIPVGARFPRPLYRSRVFPGFGGRSMMGIDR